MLIYLIFDFLYYQIIFIIIISATITIIIVFIIILISIIISVTLTVTIYHLYALNSANYAALIYNTLLQRIKTSPKFPANSPSTYSSVSANYRNCSDDDGDSDDNDEKNDDDDDNSDDDDDDEYK